MSVLADRRVKRTLIAGAILFVLSIFAADRWVAGTELPSLSPATSATVLDRNGVLLRAYQVENGLWRLPVRGDTVDRGYLDLLFAYEDKRFWDHAGVDALAMARAVWSSVKAGRIVSGGSTLTMQVARLLEETPTRSFKGKLRQMRVALALERALDKSEILRLYLALAPFGGNIEGVRAASLSYFGKEPRRLTQAEAALLVALPQSPEGRRPDRFPARARAARDRVLDRAVLAGALDPNDAAAAKTEAVPERRLAFAQLAPHVADRLRGVGAVRTTLDAGLQGKLEALLKARARSLGARISAAAIVADHQTGEILAQVGSADLHDTARGGYVDMSRAVRSPGSTLKPLIYGLAFEQGAGHPETLIDDRPMRFGRYAPQNFDRQYHGTVTIRKALQLSLNIPAVAVLDAIGTARLVSRMRRAGVKARLPGGDAPGLAIALGGLGLSLHDLVTLYAGLARGGEAVELTASPSSLTLTPHAGRRDVLLSPEAAWQVADILASAPAPENALQEALAFKTGTSYGHRDAWAVGFDGRHVIGLWFGRPDGAPSPGILGLGTAAPALFEAFARLKAAPDPLPPPPAQVLTLTTAELPAPLRRFRGAGRNVAAANAPAISFPPDGAVLVVAGGDALPLKVRDGVAPFAWLVDGEKIDADPRARQVWMTPEGPGFVLISVVDANGKAARVRVRVE